MTGTLDLDQIPINFNFMLKKTLDNFIIGDNQLIIDSLKKIENQNQVILIYGEKSSGKTHLCEAILNLNSIKYLFLNDEINLNGLPLNNKYNILIIDDIDKILVKNNSEEILFTLINNQIINNNIVIMTSTKDINECDIRLLDLKSRIISDQIFKIRDLSDDKKRDLIKKSCSDRGLEISHHVVDYILNNCNRDLYFLCRFINDLDSASLSLKRKITIPFIKKVLSLRTCI